MILRLLIDVIRWTWGFGPMQYGDTVTEGLGFLMMLGAFIDILAISAIIVFLLTSDWFKGWIGRSKNKHND